MICPECHYPRTRVDRTNPFPDATRRYRSCPKCHYRFTTIELPGQIKVEEGEVVQIQTKEFSQCPA